MTVVEHVGVRWRRVYGLAATHSANDLYQGAIPALLPFFVLERGYSYAAVTGITLAATFISSLAQPAFGMMSDRRNMSMLAPVGLILAGIGVGLAGLGDSYVFTWIAIALSGLGVAAFHPEASRAARNAGAGAARTMSIFALGGSIGFALAPIFVTPIIDTGGLAATPYLAIPALVVGLLFVVVLRGDRRTARAPKKIEADRPDDWRSFRWLTAVVICRSIAFFTVSSLIALYFTGPLGGSQLSGATALTLFLVIGAVGTLVGGFIADRIGRVVTSRIGFAAAIPGFVVLLLAPSPAVAYAGVVLLAVGLYLPFSVMVSMGQEYLPGRVGLASGVTLGLAVSVGGIFAPVFGILADRADLTTSFAVLAIFPVAALAIMTRLRDVHPARPAGRHMSRSTSV
ncbi:MFS transporter [Epidermidibacterium keratini]|uniref:MFS transporter n=1 Tax=Epidermidibacterium keratini TaxID=1891644 RepID=A0A7L4YKC4_9ACTN|nr:MFS transporter [Epidermidibacterium keratini]QHB99714.1 MFS transporter [Epidermidibacterium keratini]